MFGEACDELLDLVATEKGYGNALYALTIELCCCLTCTCCE